MLFILTEMQEQYGFFVVVVYSAVCHLQKKYCSAVVTWYSDDIDGNIYHALNLIQ